MPWRTSQEVPVLHGLCFCFSLSFLPWVSPHDELQSVRWNKPFIPMLLLVMVFIRVIESKLLHPPPQIITLVIFFQPSHFSTYGCQELRLAYYGTKSNQHGAHNYWAIPPAPERLVFDQGKPKQGDMHKMTLSYHPGEWNYHNSLLMFDTFSLGQNSS